MKQASITIIITENDTGETDIKRYIVGISQDAAAGVCRQAALALDRERIRAELEAEQRQEGGDDD